MWAVTHVPQVVVNFLEHLGYSPFHNVTEVFIVDVVVLSTYCSLGALFKFVLSVTALLVIRYHTTMQGYA